MTKRDRAELRDAARLSKNIFEICDRIIAASKSNPCNDLFNVFNVLTACNLSLIKGTINCFGVLRFGNFQPYYRRRRALTDIQIDLLRSKVGGLADELIDDFQAVDLKLFLLNQSSLHQRPRVRNYVEPSDI